MSSRTTRGSKRSRDSSTSFVFPNKAPRNGTTSRSRMAATISPTQDDSELCTRCRAIDPNSIFEKQFSRHDDRIIAQLGPIDSDLVRSTCLLCSFFAGLVIAAGSSSDSQRASTYALRTFPAVRKLGYIRSSNQRSMGKLAETTTLGLVRMEKVSSQKMHLSTKQDVLSTIGFIYPTVLPKFLDAPHISGRRLEPDKIDFTIIQDWIQRCLS